MSHREPLTLSSSLDGPAPILFWAMLPVGWVLLAASVCAPSYTLHYYTAFWLALGVAVLGFVPTLIPLARAIKRQNQYGRSTLTLFNAPALLGRQLEGHIRTEHPVDAVDGFLLILHCSHRQNISSDDEISKVVWREEKLVRSSADGSIPAAFALPAAGLATLTDDPNIEIVWRLQVAAKVPEGTVAYQAAFDVPVERSPLSPDAPAAVDAPGLQRPEQFNAQLGRGELFPSRATLPNSDTSGAREFNFPHDPDIGRALLLGVFAAVTVGLGWLLAYFEVGPIFPLLCGGLVFSLLILAAYQIFGATLVTASQSGITIRTTLFGLTLGWPATIPASQIREIKTVRLPAPGESLGGNAYICQVQLMRHRGRPITLGKKITDESSARQLELELTQCLKS
jgi:hypothetical protein